MSAHIFDFTDGCSFGFGRRLHIRVGVYVAPADRGGSYFFSLQGFTGNTYSLIRIDSGSEGINVSGYIIKPWIGINADMGVITKTGNNNFIIVAKFLDVIHWGMNGFSHFMDDRN